MILDGHVHIRKGEVNAEQLKTLMGKAGIEGGALISLPPEKSEGMKGVEERLENLFRWTKGQPAFYPFFWIDPTCEDAEAQVKMAVDAGVSGFKVSCVDHYPCDSRAMKTYAAIAKANKPILFHSGILYRGSRSSRYNRPAEFEDLWEIEGLKFSLAHVSWPWHDECIAVYGKIQYFTHSQKKQKPAEMFIDLTPGTPPVYREEVLTKLFRVGYRVEDNLIFGTDGVTPGYHHEWIKQWLDRDNGIYDKLDISQSVREKIYSKNFLRFLGL